VSAGTLAYARLRKAFAHAGATNVLGATPHTCRHTFAGILIDQGAAVEFAADHLGHASTKTTWDIYVHRFRARDEAATAKRELDAAFGHMLRTASNMPAGE
jgi:integrase